MKINTTNNDKNPLRKQVLNGVYGIIVTIMSLIGVIAAYTGDPTLPYIAWPTAILALILIK